VANPRKVLAVPQSVTNQRLPTEAELLELAVMTSYVFDLPIAAGLKKRLKEDAQVYWEWLQYQQHLKAKTQHASLGTDEQGHKRVAYGIGDKDSVSDPEMVTFLLALLLSCPSILSRQAGFEWVFQEVETVLVARRLNPESDRIFAAAMNKARRASRLGPPKDKALEYFRYAIVNELMDPAEVIPEVTATVNKTKAVEIVAGIENRVLNGTGDARSIWKAHKRAEQFFRKLAKRMQDESIVNSPQTGMADTESQSPVRRTKKHVARPKRLKRVKRR
jgi:hypothetical protein